MTTFPGIVSLFSSIGRPINTDLTSILFGGGAPAPVAPIGPAQALAALDTATLQRDRDIQLISQRVDVVRDLEGFEAAVRSAQSVEELLANREARNVLLIASGNEDLLDAAALVSEALTSDRTDTRSLINQIAATNIPLAELANRLQFDTAGLAVIQSEETIAAFRAEFLEARRLESLDQVTPGIADALRFQARAAGLTRAIDILGDGAAREVVLGAFGIPQEIALQPIDSQEAVVERLFDIERLQDPEFVETLARRFLINRNGFDPTASLLA